MSYDCVMGVHDLMMHDYGPGRRYLTVHCEVDASIDMMTTHDEIDNIEIGEILGKLMEMSPKELELVRQYIDFLFKK